ncbi:NAD(P)/FAD-dependent oxidoreductase [Nonomuraea thailandensis]
MRGRGGGRHPRRGGAPGDRGGSGAVPRHHRLHPPAVRRRRRRAGAHRRARPRRQDRRPAPLPRLHRRPGPRGGRHLHPGRRHRLRPVRPARALDEALAETALEAGAEIRQGHRVTGLIWENGRAAGVRVRDQSTQGSQEYEIRARLVVGADGRRSTVARLAGAERPRIAHANGRACYYAYYDDPHDGWRTTAAMWLTGRELGNAFPCDAGLTLVLLMPPVERAADFRGNLEAEFDRTVGLVPGLAERLEGCARQTRIVSSAEHPSYFRRSAGPGWALVGDAGHFKDPVTAQGIRDAVRFGRLLGERVADVLDDPAALDRATRAWERTRDAQCVHTYHWTNLLGRGTAWRTCSSSCCGR